MKEDILEQLVEDWFVSQPGWFVKHNIKFRPSREYPDYDAKKDSVHSDIDIIAYSPTNEGCSKVSVVTCKSWQNGFDVSKWLNWLESDAVYNEPKAEFQKREKWKSFREIVSEKWLLAFLSKLVDETGQKSFTYNIAVTKLSGKEISENRTRLENSEIIKSRFKKHDAEIKIKILPLQEIIQDIEKRISEKETPALENTDIGRLIQVLKAAGINMAI